MPTIMLSVLLLHSLHVKWGIFFSLPPPSRHPSLSLSLSWACATSVGSVVMFLCSEWIHQLKNVLIIFIFYYTTRKPCQLGCRALGRKRERKQKGRRTSEKERESGREREEGMKEGENLREANNKQNGKEDRERQTGELREGRTKWSKVKVEDINRRVEKRKWGREADGERLSGHPEIGCDNMITLGAQR